MAKEKVSFKTPEIINGAKEIYESLKTCRVAIEKMPESSVKKSLLLSQINYEKKINAIVKKEVIAKALAAIRKNPDLINSLPDDVKAGFARNEESIVAGAKDVKKAKRK
jgi:hypothetical protein